LVMVRMSVSHWGLHALLTTGARGGAGRGGGWGYNLAVLRMSVSMMLREFCSRPSVWLGWLPSRADPQMERETWAELWGETPVIQNTRL